MLELTAARRRRWLRRLALGLLTYGAAGLLVLGTLALVGARSFGSLEPLSGSLEQERQGLAATLRRTADSLGTASTSTGHFQASLGDARTSASSAAGLARSMGATFDGLTAASDVDILGARPLGGLGQGFGQAAGQARDLAATLDALGASLDQDRADLGRSQADLAAIRDEVAALADQVEAMPPFADASAGAGALRWVFLALLAWLLVPAVTSLVVGAWLLRLVR
ncbi:MAG TPA: hypothetical protein VF763_06840 [Candidatus Limnocylindrales bacterium]